MNKLVVFGRQAFKTTIRNQLTCSSNNINVSPTLQFMRLYHPQAGPPRNPLTNAEFIYLGGGWLFIIFSLPILALFQVPVWAERRRTPPPSEEDEEIVEEVEGTDKDKGKGKDKNKDKEKQEQQKEQK